ncbi:hypothetical protein SUDANB1_07110 [Streptomyces sp. enrichment culture]|uniref:hypothetical protein n=1 Tax=Streptomyces sp. enrichment culture TaxID=1795815 RepID=UPI003F578848
MSITDLLPARISRPGRPVRKHRAVDEVTRLRSLLDGANALIRGLQLQVADRDAALDDTRAMQAEAEELVVKQQADIDDLTAERDQWRDEALALKARFSAQLAADANTHRITVPRMVRPVDGPEDEATAPIDVRPLWDALGIRPVTDPGRTH